MERESMEFDVVIVGAGPAGLAAAIQLKQVNPDLTVVVLEKGAEVGAHILSGAVVDPIGIDKLLPGWREDESHPFKTEVTADHFLLLGPAGSVRLPNIMMPPLMTNHGNYIVSLGNVCRWLATKADELGVEIYPGFAATEVLYDETGAVRGVATGDMGIGRDGEPGGNYARGMELLGKYILIGEGVRGSLAKQLIAKFKLDDGREPQKFGIGIKELWQVKSEHHKPGLVQHSFGWPLDSRTGGGSFLYHLEDNQVAVGFVLHLNYKNPWLSPFEEFQRFKTHPSIRGTFEGGKRLAYGARAITEGGYQSVPKLSFPGGALIGCSAGFVNVPRIKGSHNAVLSGILAANKLAAAIEAGRANDEPVEIENEWRSTPIGKDLKRVRNVKPLWSKFGTYIGIGLGGLDMWTNQLIGLSLFGTLKHGKSDAKCLEPAFTDARPKHATAPIDRLVTYEQVSDVNPRSKYRKIEYPKPDGVLTFDRMSSVYLSGTNHDENQPIHLQLKDAKLQFDSELGVYGGPSTRYCPAGVYEWVEKDGNQVFVINAQNCVHCKTCDIKDPDQNINWVPPQGGEGPVYPNM